MEKLKSDPFSVHAAKLYPFLVGFGVGLVAVEPYSIVCLFGV